MEVKIFACFFYFLSNMLRLYDDDFYHRSLESRDISRNMDLEEPEC